MKVFFRGGPGVGGFVDSWPETLVPSASNRSTPEWTLVDSMDSRQGRLQRVPLGFAGKIMAGDETRAVSGIDELSQRLDDIGRHVLRDLKAHRRVDQDAVQVADQGQQGPLWIGLACEVLGDADLLALHRQLDLRPGLAAG